MMRPVYNVHENHMVRILYTSNRDVERGFAIFIHNEAHLITMSTIYSQGDWREKGSRLGKFWPAISRIIIFLAASSSLWNCTQASVYMERWFVD